MLSIGGEGKRLRGVCSRRVINQFICPNVKQTLDRTPPREDATSAVTGAHKNNVSKSNKRQYFTEKKNLVDRKMFKSTFTLPYLTFLPTRNKNMKCFRINRVYS